MTQEDRRPLGPRLLKLMVCLGVCLLPGVVGSLFGPGEWYQELTKPALTPPGWVFPVVWTPLYVLMGVALFLFVDEPAEQPGTAALAVFGGQLLLNGAWSWLFFGLHRPGLALIEIGVLWISILASIMLFWRRRPLAGAILLPYLLWVSFASWLNFAFWRLN